MFNKLLKKLKFRKEEIRILIPKDIDKEDFIGGTKDFHKIKETFKRGEITSETNGKKVRYWKQVYVSQDKKEDLFIPIFWKVATKPVKKDQSLTDF
jgi:hypothetical protein